MVSGQPVVAKKKIFFFGKSFLYIKRNILSHRASLYLAPRVRMRRASPVSIGCFFFVPFVQYFNLQQALAWRYYRTDAFEIN